MKKEDRCSPSRKGSVNYPLVECNSSIHSVCPLDQSTWVLIFANQSQVRVQISPTCNAHIYRALYIERARNSRIIESFVCRSATTTEQLLTH